MTAKSVSIFLPLLLAHLSAFLIPDEQVAIFLIPDTIQAGLGISACILCLIWIVKAPLTLKYRYRAVYLVFICVLVFINGLTLRALILKSPNQGLLDEISRSQFYVAEVCDFPKATSTKELHARIIGYRGVSALGNSWMDVRCHLYLGQPYALKFGDTIIVKAELQQFSDQLLAGVFNYGEYMRSKKVYWKAYVRTHNVLTIRPCQRNTWTQKIGMYRIELLRYLNRFKLSDECRVLMSALVVGEKSAMDRKLKLAFQKSGSAHLLAVSGMHMGIVYWILNLVFGFVQRWKNGKAVYFVILTSSLWAFALFAGFGASVRRACLLFTLVLLNKLLNRKASTFHILLGVVFLLVNIFPSLPFDLGFQLSVVATAGIILFYVPMRRALMVRSGIGKPVLELILVSIAAQLAVAPLCIFQFHQFQILFILSNLILTPLITMLMIWGIVTMSVGWIAPASVLWGTVGDSLTRLTINANNHIGNIDFAFLSGIPMTPIELFWWSCALTVVACAPRFKAEKRWIAVAIILCSIRIVVDGYRYARQWIDDDIEVLNWQREKSKRNCLRIGQNYICFEEDELNNEPLSKDLWPYLLRNGSAAPGLVHYFTPPRTEIVVSEDVLIEMSSSSD